MNTQHEVLLTKRFEFSASHRYYREEWSEAENLRVFGPNAWPHGHGHNYVLEVTLRGAPDPKTGMVMDLVKVKEAVLEVLKEFDHKNLNLDTPYFTDLIPTTENIARVLWALIQRRLPKALRRGSGQARLAAVRVYEDERLYVDYHGGE